MGRFLRHGVVAAKGYYGCFDRKVDSGDYKPEDYRVMQSDGYRQRLGEMRHRLSFGCDVDAFKNIVSGLPAGESLCGTYAVGLIAVTLFLTISYEFVLIFCSTVLFCFLLFGCALLGVSSVTYAAFNETYNLL